MKDKVKRSTEKMGDQTQFLKVEIHSRHRKLVVRDLKTGKYTKKPNKH